MNRRFLVLGEWVTTRGNYDSTTVLGLTEEAPHVPFNADPSCGVFYTTIEVA